MKFTENENNKPNFDKNFENIENNAKLGINIKEEENNDNQENIAENEDNNDEFSRTLHHIDDPTCERCINNMKDLIFHEDNVLNDQTTVVVQLLERCLSDKNPGLEQSEVNLQQLTDLNPRLNLGID